MMMIETVMLTLKVVAIQLIIVKMVTMLMIVLEHLADRVLGAGHISNCLNKEQSMKYIFQ